MNRRKKRRLKRLLRRIIGITILLLPVILLTGFIFFFISNRNSKKADENKTKKPSVEVSDTTDEPEIITASILTAGDILMQDPLLTSSHYRIEDGSFDYHSIFKYIKSQYDAADFMVHNMEGTLSDTLFKGYPRFSAPTAIAKALKDSSTDLCLLANNHIYDFYDDGFYRTIDAITENAMLYAGVRKSTVEKTYLIQEINGIKIGFFNYVYDTGKSGNSVKSINSIPVDNATAPLINTFNYGNTQALYSEIELGLSEMKAAGVEYTIAYIHWGVEYQTTENSRQRDIAANLCELGIDALIGGHPHVVQPVDLLTNTDGTHQMICAYSLGNHLSDQYKERMDSKPTGHTEDGLMVNLVLQRNEDNTLSLVQVDFIPTWVYRTSHLEDGGNPIYYIMPLANAEKIIKEASDLDIATDVQESLNRTNAIIETGVQKIQQALPITNK